MTNLNISFMPNWIEKLEQSPKQANLDYLRAQVRRTPQILDNLTPSDLKRLVMLLSVDSMPEGRPRKPDAGKPARLRSTAALLHANLDGISWSKAIEKAGLDPKKHKKPDALNVDLLLELIIPSFEFSSIGAMPTMNKPTETLERFSLSYSDVIQALDNLNTPA
ncbi:MAG: hypothetical protein WCS28_07175 [Thiomicrospira sp.]|jgi:hypothetical protein